MTADSKKSALEWMYARVEEIGRKDRDKEKSATKKMDENIHMDDKSMNQRLTTAHGLFRSQTTLLDLGIVLFYFHNHSWI